MDNKKLDLKRLRVTMTIKSLLIFLGIIFMQLIAYMLCVLGYVIYGMAQGKEYARALAEISLLNTTQSTNLMLLISAVSALLSFIWCAILYNRSSWRDKNTDYRKVFSKRNILLVFCIGSGCCILLTFGLSALTVVMPDVFKNYTELMSNFETGNIFLTILYAVFIGPISEEMIFRGAIFDRFYLVFDFWIANMLQAAFFGIYHMNLVQGLYAFILGIILGLIVKTTGSIFCSMLTHIIFNATTYLLPVLLGTGVAAVNMLVMAISVILVIAGIFGIKILVKSFS